MLVLAILLTGVAALARAPGIARPAGVGLAASSPAGPTLPSLAVPAPGIADTDLGWQPPTPLEAQATANANLGDLALSSGGNGMIVWQRDGVRSSIFATHFVPGAGAAGTNWEVPVEISTGPNNNWAPTVAMDGSGDAIAVWYDSSIYAIHASVYRPGAGWGASVGIDQPYWLSLYPQIAMNAGGTAFATWMAWDGARYNLFANRYVPGSGWGTAVSIEATVNTTYDPRIGVDDAGNAIVTWYQLDGPSYHVMAARFSVGSGWLAPVLIESSPAWAINPDIAMDGDGNAVVAWVEWDGIYNIWANRYDRSTGWGTAATIESNANWAWTARPGVAANRGNAVVVYTLSEVGPSANSVYASRYVSGSGWKVEVAVDGTGYPAAWGSVALDPAGNALVSYQVTITNSNPPNQLVPQAVRWDNTGGMWSGYSQLDSVRVGSGAPSVGIDGKGDGLAVWNYDEKSEPRAPRNGILTNRFTVATGWQYYWQAQKAEWDEYTDAEWLQLHSNDAGNAVLSYTQNDGPIWNGYAILYTPGVGWSQPALVERMDRGSVLEEWSAIDGDGNALTLYAIFDGVAWGVYSTYYSVTNGWGAPQRVDSLSSANYWLRIAMDAGGDGMAVWQEHDGSAWSIFANRFDRTTATWGTAAKIESSNNYAVGCDVAMDGNGNAMAVWNQWDGSTYSNYANVYQAGIGWGSPVLIEQSSEQAGTPSIAMNGNGDAVVSWSWWSGTNWDAGANTYGSGTGWGAETTFETAFGNGYVAKPAIDGAGNGLVAYQLWDGTQWSLFAVRHVAGGSWESSVPLQAAAGDGVSITVALDYRGNGYATWAQWSGGTWGIDAARYVTGQGWTSSVPVSPAATPQDDAGYPNVAVDGHGNALLAWHQWKSGVLIPWGARYVVGDGLPNLGLSSPTSGVTNAPTQTVSGTTDPGTSVTVDGVPQLVDSSGFFTETVSLPEGAHTFTVVATDAAGMSRTASVTVTVDTRPPSVVITSPASGATVSVPTVTVTGTTEPGTTLVVNGYAVDVSGTGAFSMRLALATGANLIMATATDSAGNTASASVSVTYTDPAPGLRQQLNDTQSNLNTAQGTIGTMGTELLILMVLVVVSLAVGLYQFAQIRKLRPRSAEPPKPVGPNPPPPPT